MCINCGNLPGSRGCLKVGTNFLHKLGVIEVDHTSTVEEPYLANVESECEMKERIEGTETLTESTFVMHGGVEENPTLITANIVDDDSLIPNTSG